MFRILLKTRRGGKSVECAAEIREGRIGDALSWRHSTSDFVGSLILEAFRMLVNKFYCKLYHQQPAGYQPNAHLTSSSLISSPSSHFLPSFLFSPRQRAQPLSGEHPYHNCLFFPPLRLSLHLLVANFIHITSTLTHTPKHARTHIHWRPVLQAVDI